MKRFFTVVFIVFALCANITQLEARGIADTTTGQAAELVLNHGLKFNSGLTQNDITLGYGNRDLSLSQPLTRLEFYVMLSRAFGELPQPEGGLDIMFPQEVNFQSVPGWARDDVENIRRARILTEAAPLTEYVSAEEVRLILLRIHSLLGSSLTDDFYSTVNKEFINTTVLQPGRPAETMFSILEREIEHKIASIVEELVSNPQESNTPGQKVADVYRNYLDFERRNSVGIQPIESYINALKEVQTLEELSNVCTWIYEALVYDVFAGFSIGIDLMDSNKRIMAFGVRGPDQTKDFYLSGATERHDLYLSYLENMLKIAGCFDDDFIRDAPRKVFDFERTLAAFVLDPQDLYNPEILYNIFTFNEIKEMLTNVNIEQLFLATGFAASEEIMIGNVAICREFGNYYIEENLDTLKTVAIVNLIRNHASILSVDLERNNLWFNNQMRGIEGEITDEQKALNVISGIFSDYLSSMYAEKFFPQAAKEDVERMCREFISIYKQRITALDWMSDETKQKAIAKLDAMGINIGYPDKYDTDALDNTIITGADEGGLFFDNIIAIRLEQHNDNIRKQFLPIDKELLGWVSYEVNAYYQFHSNSINFPAGILQPPFYDINASREANLGAIGAVIGHEITHAFDNNGSQYDENGNFNNWWTEEDYEAFWSLLGNVVDAFDGYEIVPGIQNNGELTLSENVADLGGLSVALEIVNAIENPDYDAFFKSNTIIWKSVISRNFLEFLTANDTHSMSKARINLQFRNFEEFHQTYGITEGDFMYLPQELRLRIW